MTSLNKASLHLWTMFTFICQRFMNILLSFNLCMSLPENPHGAVNVALSVVLVLPNEITQSITNNPGQPDISFCMICTVAKSMLNTNKNNFLVMLFAFVHQYSWTPT